MPARRLHEKTPDCKNYNDSRVQLRTSDLLKPLSDHHSTLSYWGDQREILVGTPLCREAPVTQTADAIFSNRAKTQLGRIFASEFPPKFTNSHTHREMFSLNLVESDQILVVFTLFKWLICTPTKYRLVYTIQSSEKYKLQSKFGLIQQDSETSEL